MRIVFCDDQPILAEGLSAVLRTRYPDLRFHYYPSAAALLGGADNWADADLLIMDLRLPDANGFSLLTRVRALRERLPVVILSAENSRESVLRALDLGAMGFIHKSSPIQDVVAALETVAKGGIHLPLADLMPGSVPAQGAPARQSLDLTPRQLQILHRVLQGKSIKRISADMGIAESTVKTHVTPILRALGATTRTEAIVKAAALGIKAQHDAPAQEEARALSRA